MDTLKWLIDVVLHLDRHLTEMSNALGGWLYVTLFVGGLL
jgi:membrane-associated protein